MIQLLNDIWICDSCGKKFFNWIQAKKHELPCENEKKSREVGALIKDMDDFFESLKK